MLTDFNVFQPEVSELFVHALDKNLAIICFTLDRKVTYANDNFAATMKYRTKDLIGKSHSDFCFSTFVNSNEYCRFWRGLECVKSFQD